MVHAGLPRISKQEDQGPPDDLDSVKGDRAIESEPSLS
mgnify:FL=1